MCYRDGMDVKLFLDFVEKKAGKIAEKLRPWCVTEKTVPKVTDEFVLEFLESLSERRRLAVELRFSEDGIRTYKAVGNALGVSPERARQYVAECYRAFMTVRRSAK